METHEDPYKPHHNLAAARELLNRGWAMPNAVECSWLCGHHVSAEYFNGHKAQESRNGHNPSKKVDDTTPSTAQDTENSVPAEASAEADTAQAAVAVQDSQEEPAPYSDTGASPENSPTMSFTDIDSLPDRFWMRCPRPVREIGREGQNPPLPLGPDDPLPNIDRDQGSRLPRSGPHRRRCSREVLGTGRRTDRDSGRPGRAVALQSGTSRSLHLGVGPGPDAQPVPARPRGPATPGPLTQVSAVPPAFACPEKPASRTKSPLRQPRPHARIVLTQIESRRLDWRRSATSPP